MHQKLQGDQNHPQPLRLLTNELRKTSELEARRYMSLYSALELGVGSTVIEEMDPDSRSRLYHVIAEEISANYQSTQAPDQPETAVWISKLQSTDGAQIASRCIFLA